MANHLKLDDDHSFEINKEQQSSSDTFKNGSVTGMITANKQGGAKEDMMMIGGGSSKERAKAESSSTGGFLEMAKTVAVVGGAALAAGWGLYSLLSSSSENEEKMMKAPGKEGEYIPREPFEDNPRDYFRQLRNSKR